jgi:CMP-N,N'-diacetyllegionaminic acid synthase
MKILTMIPARLGSNRIKKKNLRFLGDKPLIEHIITSAKNSQLANNICINSEALEFEEIAKRSNVNFYKRPDYLSSDSATNDDFAIDFLNNFECDILIQLLPTSPFISSEEIDEFVETMISKKYQTMISIVNVQIESVYKNKPINFDQMKKTPPSQDLDPIKAYACGIMGWETNRFKQNIQNHGAAYHGGDGSIGYYELKGYSCIDIDNEEDFVLAEAVLNSKKEKPVEPKYFSTTKNEIQDADRERILIEDGVKDNFMNEYNKEINHIDDIINKHGFNKSWSHTLINSLSNCVTLIAQMPGEGNRMHYHHSWDEWWYIIQGDWEWIVEGEIKKVTKGDVVFIERNKKHKIKAIGNSMSIRLAVSREDVDHVYENEDY